MRFNVLKVIKKELKNSYIVERNVEEIKRVLIRPKELVDAQKEASQSSREA